MAVPHLQNQKAQFQGVSHRPRLDRAPHMAPEGFALPLPKGATRSNEDYDPFQDHTGAEGVYYASSPKAPSYKTCCTCAGLGMVEVNNGEGGYWTQYCEDCAAGIELEAQESAMLDAWDRECAA